ncbi:MAG: hypothetical protein Q8O19_03725, partial [Rectinemataceae bacterium]|nr:hypothetical protein [Rectinemataceae bacterium]
MTRKRVVRAPLSFYRTWQKTAANTGFMVLAMVHGDPLRKIRKLVCISPKDWKRLKEIVTGIQSHSGIMKEN